ncbi:hypothetical protein RUM44_001969 [Polyplax serrata]|uniref:Uncharacterized protein n=1 Tax=Polyplax serrata TaxID=468196 RepID=A0ABR1AM87_POLSC
MFRLPERCGAQEVVEPPSGVAHLCRGRRTTETVKSTIDRKILSCPTEKQPPEPALPPPFLPRAADEWTKTEKKDRKICKVCFTSLNSPGSYSPNCFPFSNPGGSDRLGAFDRTRQFHVGVRCV